MCAANSGEVAVDAGGGIQEIKLPPETAALAASSLPGYQVAMQKCALCHSVDYITLQPPNMTLKQWTAEMVKMQHAYGAPISDEEVNLVAVYLTAAYGDVGTVPPAEQ